MDKDFGQNKISNSVKIKDTKHSSLTQCEHIHFIGIGGVGISALAKMLAYKGKEISGINDSDSKETLNELREQGVEISNFNKGQPVLFEDDIDVFIYSVAWQQRAPEVLAAAHATGKRVLTYFEALGDIAKEYKLVAISGTHGKTTTTAMTAQALIASGIDPTVIVGSLTDFGNGVCTNFRLGNSEYLVVEACEYKRHFLNFYPYIFAVTNIEFDHPDYYKDLSDVESAFAEAASQSEIVLTQESKEKFLPRVPELKVLGEHNRQNAALALAIADTLGANLEKCKQALSEFSGSWRRLEYRGDTLGGAKVYDDYAHHPTAIKAVLETIRHNNSGKIIAVFQPHMFSRTRALFKDFAESFTDADEVIIAPIYSAREEPISGVTAESLASEVAKHHQNTTHAASLREAAGLANTKAGNGDRIIFLSAGDIYQEIPKIINNESQLNCYNK